jgi:uncharacterized protein (TIGR01777 family)
MAGRRILISGSTGLIGRRLVTALASDGDLVVPLVRGAAAPPPPAIHWDAVSPSTLSGFDAVVHLAGEPVTGGRWTTAKRRLIYDSRVLGTGRFAAALAAAPRPPGVFVCASGINFYGDRGDQVVDESTPRGVGFLADVCADWEAAAGPLAGGSRVVHLRIGMVLAADGGPLATLLPAFRLGLGGPVAGGRCYASWVTLDDTVRAIQHVMGSDRLAGAVNVVAPEPVTNGAFTRALADAVGRPAVLPVPGWAVRLAFGRLADETVLTSIRAVPRRLLADGFRFAQASVGPALRHLLCDGGGGST